MRRCRGLRSGSVIEVAQRCALTGFTRPPRVGERCEFRDCKVDRIKRILRRHDVSRSGGQGYDVEEEEEGCTRVDRGKIERLPNEVSSPSIPFPLVNGSPFFQGVWRYSYECMRQPWGSNFDPRRRITFRGAGSREATKDWNSLASVAKVTTDSLHNEFASTRLIQFWREGLSSVPPPPPPRASTSIHGSRAEFIAKMTGLEGGMRAARWMVCGCDSRIVLRQKSCPQANELGFGASFLWDTPLSFIEKPRSTSSRMVFVIDISRAIFVASIDGRTYDEEIESLVVLVRVCGCRIVSTVISSFPSSIVTPFERRSHGYREDAYTF
ncbi:hypothetical protein EV421DRAFT_1743475 [Armillaria borealis]|uniref:Uncharacterized protein n=1 Tax=Armillaria borealis TaxID=47425 RepID=A0AA39IXM4_9AGAR|nr:hypothetical protein EV421DRAFT_1743475 [Armillaria borealis]